MAARLEGVGERNAKFVEVSSIDAGEAHADPMTRNHELTCQLDRLGL